jgi:hypothetical protein
MVEAVPVKGRYLAPNEAGRVLGVSGARVRQMVAEGKLPAVVTSLRELESGGPAPSPRRFPLSARLGSSTKAAPARST